MSYSMKLEQTQDVPADGLPALVVLRCLDKDDADKKEKDVKKVFKGKTYKREDKP